LRIGAVLLACLTVAALAPATTAAAGRPRPEAASFEVRGSVHQVGVLGAPAGAAVGLRGPGDKREGWHGTIDENGGYLFRNVPAGAGYAVTITTPEGVERADGINVLAANATPSRSLYANQRLETANLSATSGYGYLRTRDGTTLSVQVVLPGLPEDGPYPAVVEYSGYDPSSPDTGQPQYRLLMPPMGFAWVGVNIRGTGCSGGAFNFFENLQALDGYDAIETVAAQPWSNGRVGMVGISYGGISQLFVARTRPPHLAAITPVSVIDDTWRGTLYPGGIFNDGFALDWATERLEQNKWPNPNPPKWVRAQIDGGDDTCAANMGLRGQNVDLLEQIREHPYYPDFDDEFRYDFPQGGASLAPAEFVGRIKAPVFLAGAWQDEQTGGHWANMLDRFAPDTLVRAVGQNGVHIESLDPAVLLETTEFLQLYVAHQVPKLPETIRTAAPLIWATVTGVSGLTIPPDRFTDYTSHRKARKAFASEPPVRILWETGNAPGEQPGAPVNAAETSHAAWPIPGTRATTFWFQADGGLTRRRPTRSGTDEYRPNPEARPRTSLTAGNVWSADPPYEWAPVEAGSSLAYLSAPLEATTTMAGTGSVDLWIASSATDADVQVTLSEVRPDGTERYVQNGWLRLSHRATDPSRSTPLNPFHPDTEDAARPMPEGPMVPARVAIFPFAHQFRAGSRIRLTLTAPGGDRPEWTFATPETNGEVTLQVGRGGAKASRVVLPVIVDGPDLGTEPAPCPSLRAQPCRTSSG